MDFYIPEVGGDLVSTVALDCVLLWRALGDLEAIFWVDGVGAISRTGDFAAVETVAQDAASTLTGHLIADRAAVASSRSHLG
jgi:hypothetical protein